MVNNHKALLLERYRLMEEIAQAADHIKAIDALLKVAEAKV